MRKLIDSMTAWNNRSGHKKTSIVTAVKDKKNSTRVTIPSTVTDDHIPHSITQACVRVKNNRVGHVSIYHELKINNWDIKTYSQEDERTKMWFGKLGFGESCHREILQIRTVQITPRRVRTSFKRAAVWGGGAAQANRAAIGERVVTAQVSDRERRSSV